MKRNSDKPGAACRTGLSPLLKATLARESPGEKLAVMIASLPPDKVTLADLMPSGVPGAAPVQFFERPTSQAAES